MVRSAFAALLLLAGLAGSACSSDTNRSEMLRAPRTGARSDVPIARGPFDRELVARCGQPELSGEDGRSELVRFPYLQQVGSDSAMVLWTATSPAPYAVEVNDPDGTAVGSFASELDDSASPPDAHQHVATLTDLTPGAVHCYTVVGEDGALAGPFGFRTAPEPGTGAPVAFIAFGDSGTGEAGQQAVIEQIQRVRFDLALGTGDLAYPAGTRAQFERVFFDMYEPMLASVPFFPIAGNHDYRTDDGAPFREVFAMPENGGPEGRERWYSFDWGDVHFVGIDRGALDEAQARWLEADLEQNELPWTVVFTHQSPYSSGVHGPSLEFRERFAPILERHGVQLVLAGHDHNYERSSAINGVTYVVTGGGGQDTRAIAPSPSTAFAAEVLHFVYVRVEGAHLRLYAIDATGQEFDFAHIVNPELAPASPDEPGSGVERSGP